MRRGMWTVGAVLLLGAVTGCSSGTTSDSPAGAKENVAPKTDQSFRADQSAVSGPMPQVTTTTTQKVPVAPVAATTTTEKGGASVQTMPPVTTSTTLLQKK